MVLAFYVFYSLSTDLTSKILDSKGLLSSNTSNILGSFFTIIEFTAFCYFFYVNLQISILKKIIAITIVCFSFFCLANLFLQFGKNENLDTLPVTAESIIVMILCIFYFFEQIRSPNSLFIYNTFQFWTVTGILIYLSGTFFIFILSSNFTQEEFNKYWFINYIFNTIKNILFGLGIYIHGRNQRKTVEKNPFDYYSVLENP